MLLQLRHAGHLVAGRVPDTYGGIQSSAEHKLIFAVQSEHLSFVVSQNLNHDEERNLTFTIQYLHGVHIQPSFLFQKAKLQRFLQNRSFQLPRDLSLQLLDFVVTIVVGQS